MQLNDLPPGWAWTTLGALAVVKGGLTLGKKRKPADQVRLVPYLRVANVQRGYLTLKEVKTVLATEEEIRALQLVEGDVLFNEGGDRDKLGRGWIWSGEIPECIHQNHVFRARLRTHEVLPKFVSLYANSSGQTYFVDKGKQTTNLASISLTQLSTLPLPLPPANEQKRIVAKVESLLARSRRAREALDSIPALLERFRQSVLAAAFRGDLTRDWREKNPDVEPASKLLERIRAERRRRWEEAELERMRARGKPPKDDAWKARYEEPLRSDEEPPLSIPEEWCWTSLDTLTLIKGGLALGKKRQGGEVLLVRPYLRVANVQRGHLDFEEIKEVEVTPDEARELSLAAGDVLFNEGGDRDKLGRGWIWEAQIRDCIHQNHVFRARPVSRTLEPKLISWYSNTFGQQYFLDEAKQTTNLASVSMTKLRCLPVPLISEREQVVLAERISALLARIDMLERAHEEGLRKLPELEKSLLAKAFRGELVPQDPSDEPASVLLERIRAEREASQASTATPKRRTKKAS